MTRPQQASDRAEPREWDVGNRALIVSAGGQRAGRAQCPLSAAASSR